MAAARPDRSPIHRPPKIRLRGNSHPTRPPEVGELPPESATSCRLAKSRTVQRFTRAAVPGGWPVHMNAEVIHGQPNVAACHDHAALRGMKSARVGALDLIRAFASVRRHWSATYCRRHAIRSPLGTPHAICDRMLSQRTTAPARSAPGARPHKTDAFRHPAGHQVPFLPHHQKVEVPFHRCRRFKCRFLPAAARHEP